MTASDHNFVLKQRAVEQLQNHHDRLRHELKRLDNKIGLYRTRPVGSELREDTIIGKATTLVTARAGATLGSGTFEIQTADGAGMPATTAAPNRNTITAYNVTDTTIASGTYVRLVRDFATGEWITETVEAAGGSSVREISYVKAQGYWTIFSGSAFPSTTSDVVASVSVKLCDVDGTESGAAFTCLLPITNTGNDPNVVPGQIFIAAETLDPSDSAASWSALAGHEDAAIGVVRMLTRNNPSGPASGWAEMDSTDNAAPRGSGIDMAGAVPKHDCDVSEGTSNSGTADPSTTSGSTNPGYRMSTINMTGSSGIMTTDSSGTLTTDAASGTTDSAGAHTHATGSHTHTVSGTSGTSSGTTGGSGTLTTSTHSIETVWAEEDMSITESVAGFAAISDSDADGTPDNYDHNHTIASHTHTIGSHSHSFSSTTGSSSGSTASSGAHTHTFGSHDHDLASHNHTIAAHEHQIPQLSVPGVAHTHTTEKQLTKTLCFFERIDNSDWT